MSGYSYLRYFFLILIASTSVSCANLRCSGCHNTCTDNDINTTVQVRIAGDSCLYYQNIRVTTFDRVVTLEGGVDNPTQREAANEMAATAPCVKRVVSRLKIKGKYNI